MRTTWAYFYESGMGEVDRMLHDDRWEFVADENGVPAASLCPAPSGGKEP